MITIEQIDEFRKRTNSSYSDTKYFLEKQWKYPGCNH